MKIADRTDRAALRQPPRPATAGRAKANGGRSDAVNAGLNVARQELVAIVDADTLLEADALKRIVEVFAADPDDVVAVGGTIRIANGAVIENNVVTSPAGPAAGVEATQAASTCAASRRPDRLVAMNGLLIISGAFGVFRRDLVRAAGGLSQADARRGHGARDAPAPSAAPAAAADPDRVRPRRERLDGDPDRPRAASRPAHPLACRPARQPPHPPADDRPPALRRRRDCSPLPYTILFEVLGPLLQLAGYAS